MWIKKDYCYNFHVFELEVLLALTLKGTFQYIYVFEARRVPVVSEQILVPDASGKRQTTFLAL